MILDSDFHFVEANKAYLDITSRRRSEVVDHYAFDAFPESAERVEVLKATFRRVLQGETVVLNSVPFAIEVDGNMVEYWWDLTHQPLADETGRITHIVQYSENITEKIRLEKLNDAILGELHHRINNLLTVIGAMARQVGRSARDVPEFLDRFNGKIEDLVRSQRGLNRDTGTASDLETTVRHQLGVYLKFAADRIHISGPAVTLNENQAKALSMTVHELGTNSLKYGAIGTETGKISVVWTLSDQGTVTLTWSENGLAVRSGPQSAERQPGYGTRLLTEILPAQLNARVTRSLDSDGLCYEMTFRPSA